MWASLFSLRSPGEASSDVLYVQHVSIWPYAYLCTQADYPLYAYKVYVFVFGGTCICVWQCVCVCICWMCVFVFGRLSLSRMFLLQHSMNAI